jgi:two-component system phosphate regulon response regulator PhoB
MKILIADDEKDFTDIMKSILTKKGYEVIIDPNGHLLDNLSYDLPDLIIIDINLPNRDGGDLCAKLKLESHTKHIPIILISAIMDLKQISQFCGAEDYLVKPFSKSDLEEKISRHLESFLGFPYSRA